MPLLEQLNGAFKAHLSSSSQPDTDNYMIFVDAVEA